MPRLPKINLVRSGCKLRRCPHGWPVITSNKLSKYFERSEGISVFWYPSEAVPFYGL